MGVVSSGIVGMVVIVNLLSYLLIYHFEMPLFYFSIAVQQNREA